MCWKPKVVYSVGVRCTTEISLRKLNLRKFSSIFGSLNCKKPSNIIKLIKSNYQYFFNFEKHIYSRYTSSMLDLTSKYGARTLLEGFDDIQNFHDALAPHHDLSKISPLMHFKRGIRRINILKEHQIPVLFIYSSNNIEDSDPEAFSTDEIGKLFEVLHSHFNCHTLALLSLKSQCAEPLDSMRLIRQKSFGLENESRIFTNKIYNVENIIPVFSKILQIYDTSSLLDILEVDNLYSLES